MKTLILAGLLAVTAVAGLDAASEPAKAWSPYGTGMPWETYTPEPSYQPFRGYDGAETYIGQDYSNLGGDSDGEAFADRDDDGGDDAGGDDTDAD